jgi:hypothetical protein
MFSRRRRLSWKLPLSAILITACLGPSGTAAQTSLLDADNGMQSHNVTVKRLSYRGRNAVRVSSLPSADAVTMRRNRARAVESSFSMAPRSMTEQSTSMSRGSLRRMRQR